MSNELVHDESLLDLLTRQQTRGEAGVRLSFHQDLMAPLGFLQSPLHYAAVTGNTALVCCLHSERKFDFASTKDITVASFAAGGRNGQTSWRIPITVYPSHTASLAGNANTAKALKYFEAGIPLHWNRQDHSRFKNNEFKLKARTLLIVDCEEVWFYALPGPARVCLTDKLMTQLARVHVWGFLDEQIWTGDWQNILGDDLFNAVDTYQNIKHERPSRSRNHQLPPQYQFSIGQVNGPVRRRRFLREGLKMLRRGISGGFWWLLLKGEKGGPSLLFTLGIFVATGYNEWLQSILPLFLRVFRDPANP